MSLTTKVAVFKEIPFMMLKKQMAPDSPLTATWAYRPSSEIKASQIGQLETSESSWYNGIFGWKLGNLRPCSNEWDRHVKLARRAHNEIESLRCAALHMASILMRLTGKLFTFLPALVVYGKVKLLLRWANNWTLIQFPGLTLSEFLCKLLKRLWGIHTFIMDTMFVMWKDLTWTVREGETWIEC